MDPVTKNGGKSCWRGTEGVKGLEVLLGRYVLTFKEESRVKGGGYDGYFLEIHELDDAVRHLEVAFSEVKGDDEWRPSVQIVWDFLEYYEEEMNVDGHDELYKITKAISFDHAWI